MSFESKEQRAVFTSSELQVRLREFFRKRGEAYLGKTWEQREKVVQQFTHEFIKQLKAESDRFQFIFETEKGSIYFIINTGQSLRFRKDGNGFEPQQIMDKIYFITEEESDALIDEIKKAGGAWQVATAIIDRKISITKIGIGAAPLEIGFASRPNSNEIEETGEHIIVRGMSFVNNGEAFSRYLKDGTEVVVNPGEKFIDYQNVNGFHIGHPIKNIEKG